MQQISFFVMRKANVLEATKTREKGLKSVLGSSAQTTALCAPGTGRETEYQAAVSRFLIDSTQPVALRALVELMQISGCRISQALSITRLNISKYGRITLKGAKGGVDVIASPVMYKSFFIDFALGLNCGFVDYDRFYVYRVFRRCGLWLAGFTSEKKAVTHSFRHALVNDISSTTVSSEGIAAVLGHKSLKSQVYYVNKKK